MNAQLQGIADRIDTSIEDVLAFLDSPSGRRWRGRLAAGLIVSMPLVMRLPGLKRSPVGRLIELGGGTVLVVKIAELIRDWERSEQGGSAQVIVVQPAPPAS